MTNKQKRRVVFLTLLILAAAFRIAIAHWLPNDAPDDGRVYAQMARNLLEQHIYSHDTQAPYTPSLIRLPGYPLFLAGIYSIFGHTSNGAVRIIQALIDTATCGLIALLAYYWQPDEKKKRATAIAALALAAVCPFTTIYAATILTEVPTNFLIMAMFVAVTLGFRKLTTEDTEEDKKRNLRKAIVWWAVAGLIGGLAVLMRPDTGLFLAAVGITLVVTALWSAATSRRSKSADKSAHSKKSFGGVLLSGSAFSLAFILLLAPWTVRNWRVFHLFQPLAPSHGEMPGEFVPRGYQAWVRTWLDDESYIAPFLWSLDTDPIDVDDLPPQAFDSPEEQKRVATLFEAYNNRSDAEPNQSNQPPAQPQATPSPQSSPAASPTPAAKPTPNSSQPQKQASQNSNANKAANENDNGEESEEGDDESDEENKPAQANQGEVEMTPEIDAAFGQLARERIARHPFRYYVVLPLKRARTMWFDTHSQYWPFEGTLLPFEDLDYDIHQQIWLPLFAGLTAIYTVLGLIGAWLLLESRKLASRRWLLLVVLAIVFRLMLFSSMENPEPRYLVEFFPILAVLGGIAIGYARRVSATDDTDKHG